MAIRGPNFLGSNHSHIYPNIISATFGRGPTVVSKKKGVRTVIMRYLGQTKHNFIGLSYSQ